MARPDHARRDVRPCAAAAGEENGVRHTTVYAGMLLLFVALGLLLLAVIRSRCPLCGVRVHPAYLPSERLHCPHCGRKAPGNMPGQPPTPEPPGN